MRFRVPSEVHHGTPAPPRRSCDRTPGDALFHGLCGRTTHAGTVDPHSRRSSAPPACRVRGFDPYRDVHHRSSRRLTATERPSACLLEAFSSRRADVLSDVAALLAFLALIRALLREAPGRGRLQGVDLGANTFGPPDTAWMNPRRARCVVASTRLSPLERSLSASWRRALMARAPRSRLDRSTSRPMRVFGSCGSPRSVCPSRGHRLVRGSSPSDRHGLVPTGAGG